METKNFEELVKENLMDVDKSNVMNLKKLELTDDKRGSNTLIAAVSEDFDGIIVRIGGTNILLDKDSSCQLGAWLLSRDYSYFDLWKLAQDIAEDIADGLNALPEELRELGFSDEMMDWVIDRNVSSDLRRMIGTQEGRDKLDKLNGLVVKELNSAHGFSFDESIIDTSRGPRSHDYNDLQELIRCSVCIRPDESPMEGPASHSRGGSRLNEFRSELASTLESIPETKSTSANTIAQAILSAAAYCIERNDATGNHNCASSRAMTFPAMINAFYLLQMKLSDTEEFIFISELYRYLIASKLYGGPTNNYHWVISQYLDRHRIFADLIPEGLENPLHAMFTIQIVVSRILKYDPNWGNKELDDFDPRSWNTEVINSCK